MVFATSWAPTGVYTDSQGLAFVEAAGVLYGFHRGNDGKLKFIANQYNYQTGVATSSWTSAVAGSPVITTDGLSAAYDPSSGKVFVAVRTLPLVQKGKGPAGTVTDGSGRVQVAEGTVGGSGISGWTWNDLGFTDASPAVVVACNRVHVAVSSGGVIYTIWRAPSGGTWSNWFWLASTNGLPSLAVNGLGEMGLATKGYNTRVYFWKMPCKTTPAFDPPVEVGDLGTSENRVGLTAYGPYFGAAIRAQDGYPYFLLQTPGSGSAVWPASFEPVQATPVPANSWQVWLHVAEPPVAVTFRGLIFLTARDASNYLYYWIRNPNTLATRPDFAMWTGGRTVYGGVATAPAALAPASTRDLKNDFANQDAAPAELFVAVRGLDNKIWALNMSRFATFDVLEGLYQMTVNTTTQFPASNGGLVGKYKAENEVLNIFENLETFLRTPSKYWDSLSDVKNGGKTNCASPGGTGITIYPNLVNDGEWVDGQCSRTPPIATGAVVDGIDGTAWKLWEEFGHEVLAMNRASNYGDKSWMATFSDKDALKPKTCSSPCLPYNRCVPASQVGYWTAKQVGASTKVCAAFAPSPGRPPMRPSGFTDDYVFNSNEHNWIYTMLLYRWFGFELNAMALNDAASGDPRLQTKYDYIRDKVYDGVEFNGSRGSDSASASRDETMGWFAMPLK